MPAERRAGPPRWLRLWRRLMIHLEGMMTVMFNAHFYLTMLTARNALMDRLVPAYLPNSRLTAFSSKLNASAWSMQYCVP